MGKALVLFLLIFVFIAIPVFILSNKKQEKDEKVEMTPTIIVATPTPKPATSVDLSYIVIFADESTNIKLLDSRGRSIGEVSLEEPSLKSLYYPKPDIGTYSAILSSPDEFNVEIYAYDRGGAFILSKFLGEKGTKTYKIDFDKSNSRNSTISPPP